STVGKRATQLSERAADAVDTLIMYFEERRRECLKKKYDAETIESERKLYNAFGKFLRTLDKHSFGLDMDMVLMMANLEGWHDIALVIAEAFKVAMSANRIEPLGIANEGPVARFVAAVIPSITGEAPTPGAVSQHLKRCAGARSGTNGK
ncbi:MAG: hypothetical protein ACREFK_11510, partial [Stellaceae bacterium]